MEVLQRRLTDAKMGRGGGGGGWVVGLQQRLAFVRKGRDGGEASGWVAALWQRLGAVFNVGRATAKEAPQQQQGVHTIIVQKSQAVAQALQQGMGVFMSEGQAGWNGLRAGLQLPSRLSKALQPPSWAGSSWGQPARGAALQGVGALQQLAGRVVQQAQVAGAHLAKEGGRLRASVDKGVAAAVQRVQRSWGGGAAGRGQGVAGLLWGEAGGRAVRRAADWGAQAARGVRRAVAGWRR